MSLHDEQKYLDVISNETEKKKNFLKIRNLEVEDDQPPEKLPPHPHNDLELEKHQLEFQAQCQREAEEKKSLLSAVIAESKASGTPLPSSLIKLLHHNNGKRYF